MRIFIIGFKNSGKTTVGIKLAEKLGYKFIDLDEQIEIMNKRSIPELFTEEGEEEFRNKEWKALIEVCKEERVVVSTGGGAPCWCDNMNLMLKKGETVYISLDLEILVDRLKKATIDRPIVKDKSVEELKEYVTGLKNNCEHHYLRAKHIIDAKNLDVDTLADRIISKL